MNETHHLHIQHSRPRHLLPRHNAPKPARYVCHPSRSHYTSFIYMGQKLETVFKKNETEKKTKYNQRVIDIEHGSFTPVVTSAYGGFGRESGKFITELINKLSLKLDLPTSVVANYVRTKISFELVRSQVMCLRGSRTKKKLNVEVGEMEVVNCASRMPES